MVPCDFESIDKELGIVPVVFTRDRYKRESMMILININ